jgi:hypothetical protein
MLLLNWWVQASSLTLLEPKHLKNWEQKTCIEEVLKKTLDMYIVRVGSKGAFVDETLFRERLIV